MAKKVSSKRLATIAGRLLASANKAAKDGWEYCGISVKDAKALAGSVLSQTEPKKKKVRK